MTRSAAINAVFLQPGMGGLETYVLELTPELLRAEPGLELTLFCNREGRELLAAQPWAGEVSLRTPAASRSGLRALYELGPLGVAARGFDVLHSPALTAPLASRAANVVVIADTTWITNPDMGKGQAPTVRLWQATVPRVARRADRVVAISGAGRGDIERHLGVPRERIDVVPLGYAAESRPTATPEAELRQRLGIGTGPIVLNVAAMKVHKNQPRLIDAFARVRSRAPEARLVIAGPPTEMEGALREHAAAAGVGEAVTFTGFVDAADVEGLYEAAAVFALPSLNEGFGLPLLEAMARGVPVVCSDVGALPEVAGEAALLVAPESADAIAGGITAVLGDAVTRTRLVEAGHERVAAFGWRRTAELTLASWDRAQAR